MNPLIKELARDMGFPPYAIRKWKLRGAVPHMHRIHLMEQAASKGARLTVKDFEFRKAVAKRRTKRGAQ